MVTIVRAKSKVAPAAGKKATASAKPAAKPVAKKTTAAVAVAKPKVMANYNRTLDLVALALTLGQQGKTVQAAKVFAAAIKHKTCASAINVINASNAVALQASKLRAAEEAAQEDNELSDDELDQLLGQGEQVEADFGEEEEGEDEGEEGDEEEGEEDEGEGEDMGEEEDAGEATLAKVLARLSGK